MLIEGNSICLKLGLLTYLLMGIRSVYIVQVCSLDTYSPILFPPELTEKNEHYDLPVQELQANFAKWQGCNPDLYYGAKSVIMC